VSTVAKKVKRPDDPLVAGLLDTIRFLSEQLAESAKESQALARRMSDQVVAHSEYQIDRLKIEASANVATNYTDKVVAPTANRIAGVTTNGTFPPEDESDFTSTPR